MQKKARSDPAFFIPANHTMILVIINVKAKKPPIDAHICLKLSSIPRILMK